MAQSTSLAQHPDWTSIEASRLRLLLLRSLEAQEASMRLLHHRQAGRHRLSGLDQSLCCSAIPRHPRLCQSLRCIVARRSLVSASQLARRRRAQMRKSARIHDLRMAAAHRKRNERSCIISPEEHAHAQEQLHDCVDHLLVQAPTCPLTRERERATRRMYDRDDAPESRTMHATPLCRQSD